MKHADSTAEFRRGVLEQELKPPEKATLTMTGHCPLYCRHCWPNYGAGTRRGPVSAIRLKKVLRELAELGIRHLVLTGGDPMTHPAWLDILGLACRNFAFSSVCLQTTAMLLNRSHVEALDPLRDMGLLLQVSLDGARPATHDAVRGDGAFERTIQGLQLLLEAGWGPRLSVAFTEMRHNLDEIDPLLAWVEKMGIGRLVCATLIVAGRAAGSDGIMPPTPDQYRKLIARYASDDGFRSRYERHASIAAVEWWRHRAETSETCCALIEHLYITAEGRIHPCVLLHAEPYSVGGVFERPLTEALMEILPHWGHLRQIGLRRASETAACRHCPYGGHCGAGCMGRAYTQSGELFAPEDRCALRKAVYSFQCSHDRPEQCAESDVHP